MTAESISEETLPVQTKTCAGCVRTFAKPPGMRDCKWAIRKHCRLDCRKTVPMATRFWARVDDSGGPDTCWLWTASRDLKGYGKFNTGYAMPPASAHRVAFVLCHGPIPDGFVVRHSCDNPSCVNPRHLSAGTYEDNANDMVVRGRSGLAKLTVATVREIRRRVGEGEKRSALAREFRVTHSTVGRIARGDCWRAVLEE